MSSKRGVDISIIIPTLNEGAWLKKTLIYLRKNLKKTSYEIIVSDGNSKDNTIKIAKRYADKIIIYRGKKRQGIARGRNDGAKHARGEYLVFIDAEIVIPKPDEFFKQALYEFEENPGLVAIAPKSRVYQSTETLTDKLVYLYLNNYNILINNLFHIGGAPGEFQMFKSSVFKKLRGYNPSLAAGEDYDLFMRASKIGRTKIIKLTIYHSARRARKVGWPKLLLTWFIDTLHLFFFKKAKSKEWEVIR